jgi:hypothetical protein
VFLTGAVFLVHPARKVCYKGGGYFIILLTLDLGATSVAPFFF